MNARPTPYRRVKVKTMTLVCRYLVKHGPSSCHDVGSVIDNRHGRIASASGGGDYAAQMLLGRMKKAGLVRHAPSDGSTLWEVTELGRKEGTK
jgi:hypothetical protein